MNEPTKPEQPEGSQPSKNSPDAGGSFMLVFAAVVVGGAIVLAAFIFSGKRPAVQTAQPTADLVAATGKCAQCHRRETGAIVHQFETSAHAKKGVTCLDCHSPREGQTAVDHQGFKITTKPTSKTCGSCHAAELEQFMRSRHAAPAWAAVHGKSHFSAEQVAHAEKYNPGATDRAPNGLALAEGEGVFATGCNHCHSIGAPNQDGSIGSCTECHSRHSTSIKLAREPATCGQCHMGPDHSQIEIFNESKHGVMFHAQHDSFNLDADPKELSVKDISVPTCSVCHMSGLEGSGVTHNVGERLSWFLFASISEKRDTYQSGQDNMKAVCTNCHSKPPIEEFYKNAEEVVHATNAKVQKMEALMKGLRDDKLLTPKPFDEPIEFLEFDYWHYFGRTAKHGAFMGGPDFVQWHGNYELLKVMGEIEEMASAIREKAGVPAHDADPKPGQDKKDK